MQSKLRPLLLDFTVEAFFQTFLQRPSQQGENTKLKDSAKEPNCRRSDAERRRVTQASEERGPLQAMPIVGYVASVLRDHNRPERRDR